MPDDKFDLDDLERREAEILERLDREARLRDAMSTKRRNKEDEEKRVRRPRPVGEFLTDPETGKIYFRRF